MTTTLVSHMSAAAAYRADLSTRTSAFGPNDGDWIALASVLERAASLPSGARDELLRHAADIAQGTVSNDEIARFAHSEWGKDSSDALDSILIVAEHAQQA